MASNSVAGINVKIGADLSDLKKKLGEVGDAVESELEPAANSVHDLRDSFKETAKSTGDSSVNIQAIAAALQTIGTALLGFTKGAIEDALKVNPDVAAPYESISGAFGDLKVALGEGLLSQLEGIAPTVTTVLNSITSFAKDNPDTAGILLGIVGGVGALGSAAVTAAPLLTLFNISLAPISGTALAVAGAIVGLVTILALLSTTLDEIGDKASTAAEEIANMDTSTQHIVENGVGELKVENRNDYDWVANVWDPSKKEFVEGWAYLDEYTGEYVLVSEEVVAAAAGTAEAVSGTTEEITGMGEAVIGTMDSTKSASEQAQEIFTNMQQTVESLGLAMDETGFTEAMTQFNDLMESEAFQELAKEPVSEDVNASWASFDSSVTSALSGIDGLKSTLEDGSVNSAITSTGDAASGAAGSFNTLAAAINGAVAAYEALIEVKSKLGGSGDTGNGTNFGGAHASGGPVHAGTTYLVGEVGPELFTPHQNGYIIPNDRLGGKGQQIVVNFNGDVIGDANSIYSLVNRAAKAAIRQEVRAAA